VLLLRCRVIFCCYRWKKSVLLRQERVKQTEVNPWDEVQIKLVGPWTFQIPPKWSVSVLVLTSIDPFSGLCDACRLENKTSSHVANKFSSLWLTRYPRPLRCIHDNGTEFTAPPFQHLLQHMGISNVTTTVIIHNRTRQLRECIYLLDKSYELSSLKQNYATTSSTQTSSTLTLNPPYHFHSTPSIAQ